MLCCVVCRHFHRFSNVFVSATCASEFFYRQLIKHNCFDKCPLECQSSQLDTHSLRKFKYPTDDDIARVLGDLESFKNFGSGSLMDVERNLVKFTAGYNRLGTVVVVEELAKIPLDDLVGSLGNHLHLLASSSSSSWPSQCVFMLVEVLSLTVHVVAK